MKTRPSTRNLPRIITLFALAGAILAAAGCATPAGQKAQEGQKEVNNTIGGVESATNTADRAADTANKAADTTKKVSNTLDRFFK